MAHCRGSFVTTCGQWKARVNRRGLFESRSQDVGQAAFSLFEGNRDRCASPLERLVAAEQRKDERQNNTQKNRRDYGEVKDGVLAAVDEVTRQTAQPRQTEFSAKHDEQAHRYEG